MQGYCRLNDATDPAWPDTISAALEIGDEGLVLGARTVLVRMVGHTGSRRLALDADSERLNAMLSVAFRRQEWSRVFHHVKEASDHWQRGDKALANLRLVFAGLPRLSEPADAYRLQLAEYLLNEGMSPDALMKELGFSSPPTDVLKYNQDEPRVPAGSGRRSGEWDFRTDVIKPSFETTNGGRFVVAQEDEKPNSKEPTQERFALTPRAGGETPAIPILPFVVPGGLVGGGPAAVGGRLGSAATRALNAQIGAHLESQGYAIIGGAGQLKEEYVRGAGPGTIGSTYVDITSQHPVTGKVVRVQTIDTRNDGSPTPREAAAAARIQSKFPSDTLHLIGKK